MIIEAESGRKRPGWARSSARSAAGRRRGRPQCQRAAGRIHSWRGVGEPLAGMTSAVEWPARAPTPLPRSGRWCRHWQPVSRVARRMTPRFPRARRRTPGPTPILGRLADVLTARGPAGDRPRRHHGSQPQSRDDHRAVAAGVRRLLFIGTTCDRYPARPPRSTCRCVRLGTLRRPQASPVVGRRSLKRSSIRCSSYTRDRGRLAGLAPTTRGGGSPLDAV